MRALAGLDEIDRTLLALLQTDDRLGLAELATEANSSPSTINDRIKRLMRVGVITGFHARLAADMVGLEVLAFVFVGLRGSKVDQDFPKKMGEISNVLECHRVTGEWSYLLKLRLRNIRELETFVSETIKSIPLVERTNTLIALASIKETWDIPLA